MSLQDVLAELDIRIRGAADVRAATAGMDQFRGAAVRADAEASRLAGQLRLLQRAEGDNTAAINETRQALDHATASANAYRNAQARIATENRGAFGRFQGSSAGFGGQGFFRPINTADPRGPNDFGGGDFNAPAGTPEWARPTTSRDIRERMTALAPAIAGVGFAFFAVDHAAHAAWESIHEVVSEGDEIGDSAARLGISARAYQELGYIAEQTGSSAEAAARAFPVLARNVAAAGGHGAQVFRELHVAVRDSNGALRSQEDIFADTVSAIGRVQNPTQQAGLAMRAFGRAGSELLPLIRSGPGEIDRLRARFRELGGGLSDDVVANADEAQQALTDFDLATSGARATLANAFLPSLADGISTFAGWIGKARQAWEQSSAGEVAFRSLRGAAIGVGAAVAVVFFPVILLGAGLVGLFLAVEDVVTAVRGGRSVFGGFAEDLLRMGGINRTFIGSLEAFGVAWDVASADAAIAVAAILANVARLEDGLGIGSRTDAVHIAAGQAAVEAGMARATALASQTGLARRESVRFADRASLADDNPNSRAVNVNIVNNGVQDPEAAGRAAGRHLDRVLRDHRDVLPRLRAAH